MFWLHRPSAKSSALSESLNLKLPVRPVFSLAGIRFGNALLSNVQYGAPFDEFVGFRTMLIVAQRSGRTSNGLPQPVPGLAPNPGTRAASCHTPPESRKPGM